MCKNFILKPLATVLAFVFVGFSFQSCLSLQGIIIENDFVLSSQRAKAHFTYTQTLERFTPLVRINQTVVKEFNSLSGNSYRIYDLITLRSNSFRISDEVYIVVDKKPFRVKVDNIELETVSKINEKRKDILTADSTSVSVVTGYDEYQQRVNRLSYTIDNTIMERVNGSKQVLLRYYAGPDMITVRVAGNNLKRLKMLINT